MRLVRLKVKHFGPVRKAVLDFGPGLNVLYGENDLGKSYLAHAIRAALLLPHYSTAHQEFVAWGTDETPQVTLAFRDGDDELWRVKKAFRTVGGAATLESSPNGEQWSMEARGRDVDGQLRRLLEWGIPEPGGKGKRLPKGLPRSFLTHVLLAEQQDATAVFEQSLGDDADESGKELLGQALQALAQDPLFKTVLERSQQKVDEAFLPTGKKRQGRQDPFRKASLAIRQALQEHEGGKQQLGETQRVQDQLKVISQEQLEAQATQEEAAAALAALEEAWRLELERREVEAKLAEAEAENAKVTAAEADAAKLAGALEERERELAQTAAALKQAEQTTGEARERQRQAESDEGVHKRELEKEQLERRLLELQAAERDARSRFEASKKAGVQLEAIEDLASQLEQRRRALEAAGAELAGLVEKNEALEKEQGQLRGVGALLRWRRAVTELAAAAAARDQAADLLRKAAELRMEGDALGAKLAEQQLPNEHEVRALHALAQELEVAQARLDVGLSVRVRLARAVDLEVSRDGGEPEKTAAATGEHVFESERAAVLRLGDLAEVEITAGAAEARRAAEALAERWREEVVPVLEAAEVTDVAALDEVWRAAEEGRRTAQERLAEAARLEAAAAELAELASQVEVCEARVREREGALEGFARSALEAAAELGDDAEATLETLARANEEALREANAKREEKRGEMDRGSNDLGHLEKRLEEEQGGREELMAALDEPWEVVFAASEAELKRISEEREEVTARRGAVDEAFGTALAEVKAKVEAATERLAQARGVVEARTAERDEAKAALEGKRGQLKVLRENAAKIELAALKTAAEQARAAVDAVVDAVDVGDGEPVTEERIAEAGRAVERGGRLLAEKSREADKLQGALEQVGGDVAVEREKEALEALLRAKDHERDLELEYGAWRLLVETLREAENEESMHLGRALVGPVSERFSELTGGRYGKIGLDPELRTTGIQAGGGHREVAALSEGLKEQLATIFRLSVAQHLESMIVLDDHLTHTDPERLGWFRQVLRSCGEEIQIVVFTCRPLDYLEEGELAGAGESLKDGGSGRLRGVDLGRVVDRAVLS